MLPIVSKLFNIMLNLVQHLPSSLLRICVWRRGSRNKFGMALLWLALCAQANALTVDTPLPDAAQEARARALFYEIRCVVCQSESIADSPADVAADLRRAVRERIVAGDGNETIKAYLSSRYGDAVLMRPPLEARTLALWFGPLLLLLAGGLLAWRRLFRTTIL